MCNTVNEYHSPEYQTMVHVDITSSFIFNAHSRMSKKQQERTEVHIYRILENVIVKLIKTTPGKTSEYFRTKISQHD
jgi:hypothetical protein